MATSHTKRSEQLEKYLKKVINNILYRKINDPRITFVTITRVSASVDLKYAKIYISIYGDENHNRNCLKALRNATKFIRREIGKDAKIRFIPEIKFLVDEDIEYQYKLLDIVNKVHKEQLHNKDENRK